MASVCAAYIYKYYTHMLTSVRTREANTHTHADIHVSAHMHAFRADDTQRGGGSREEAGRAQGGDSSVYAKHPSDTRT